MTEPAQALLKVGDQIKVTLSDMAFGGEGVARVNDFVVFVPFTIVGEEVEAELTEVKKRFARGRLLKVVRPAPDRVIPPCPYFGQCGGCQYQHIQYDSQLKLKHKQIGDLLERIGGVSKEVVDPVIASPNPYGYRNRIMVRSQWDKFKQGLNIGFLRYDNRLVVDIEDCKIAEPVLNDQLRKLRGEPPAKGGLKVVLRVAPEDWVVPQDSFFQNNFWLLPALVQTVRERVRDSGARHLIDAYCGVGFFSVELGDLVESFAGIEFDAQAVVAARKNAAHRRQTHGRFIQGRTEQLLPSLLRQHAPVSSLVLLDPPRTGCPRECLEVLRSEQPAQIIYVSCHPATLARDLNVLCGEQVYQVVKVSPLDMFPQTQHVECVADLRLAGSGN